jgi:hypothetical protein
MRGYEITLKDTKNRGWFEVLAVIEESEEKAIVSAKAECGEHYVVEKIEVVETGVIMKDSFYE